MTQGSTQIGDSEKVINFYDGDNCTARNWHITTDSEAPIPGNVVGIYIHSTNNTVIENNLIEMPAPYPGDPYNNGSRNKAGVMMYNVTLSKIGKNTFKNFTADSAGIHDKRTNDHNDIYNNWFYNCSGQGILLNSGIQNEKIHNNVSSGGTDELCFNSLDNDDRSSNGNEIFNNTSYGGTISRAMESSGDATGGNDITRNNIGFGDGSPILVNRPDYTDSDHNVFFGQEVFRIIWSYYYSFLTYRENCNDDVNSEVIPELHFQPDDGAVDGDSPNDFKLTENSNDVLKTGGDITYAAYIGAWEWPINNNQQIGALLKDEQQPPADTTPPHSPGGVNVE